jgi:hypothetical protein
MTSLARGVLQGPNMGEINAFVASLMRERCEDNFVIWDLVHGVAISEIEISRNMRQRGLCFLILNNAYFLKANLR